MDCSGFTNTYVIPALVFFVEINLLTWHRCVGSSGPFTGKPGLCVGNGFTKKAAGKNGFCPSLKS